MDRQRLFYATGEVTVKEFFSQMPAQKTEAQTKCPGGMKCKDASSQPNTAKFYCNIAAKTPLDLETDRPINCVSQDLAAQYCASLGKRLPREAEWELAAANSWQETRFPWGNNSPTCTMTNVAKGISKNTGVDDLTCRQAGEDCSGAVSLPVDQKTLIPFDRTLPWQDGTESQTIFGLAGNLSEWTSDIFYSYMEDPCTKKDSERPGVLILPPTSLNYAAYCGEILPTVAKDPELSKNREFSVRGGSFRSSLESTWSAVRSHQTGEPALPSPEIGFRCVKDL